MDSVEGGEEASLGGYVVFSVLGVSSGSWDAPDVVGGNEETPVK